MICQFVGGPLDGTRREVGGDPPGHFNAASPVRFDLSATPDPVDSLPDYVTYTRHVFRNEFGDRMSAYFCDVDPRSVVPIVLPIALTRQLYLTRPRDARVIAADLLAKLFHGQLAMWDLRALYDQVKADFGEDPPG